MKKIKVVKTKATKNLRKTIEKALQPLGNLKKFIKKGETILLKPNFNTADPFPASTDFKFLKAVAELIYEAEPKIVMLGESSTVSLNTGKVMQKLGIYKLQEEGLLKIYNFDKKAWLKKEIPNAKYLKKVSITEILYRADKIIYLPCLKTHRYAAFTGSLKLSVGFMKPIERIKLHLSHLQEKIAELNLLIKPSLIIMDARKCFITRGPEKGKVKEPNLILASTDRIAIDVEGIKIIKSYKGNDLSNINPWQLKQIKHAVSLNIGVKSEKDYSLI